MKRRLIVLMLGAYSACALAGDGREIPFIELHRGWHSGVNHTSIVQIHNQASWEELWLTSPDGDTSTTGAPAVDFDTHFVVAFYLGSRPTGGHSVDITQIDAAAGKGTLQVTETTPGQGCVVTTAVASPYHIVAVEKQAEWIPLDFSLTRTVHECRSGT